MDVSQIRGDLIAEQEDLDDIVSGLDDAQWMLPTPSPGWTVADQIGHLAYFDGTAAVAIQDPEAFTGSVNDFLEAASLGPEAADDWTLGPYRAMEPPQLLAAWRNQRSQLAAAAETLTDEARVNWYGPSMSARSFLTARLMETWAHGQDVVDAVGASRTPTERLRHIAQLGFITRGWSYANRGADAPSEPVRLEVAAPDGRTWGFGPDDADEKVAGPALDFCLVVTQRRHLDDTALETTALGREWLLIAQAFAGPPTGGPKAGTRP